MAFRKVKKELERVDVSIIEEKTGEIVGDRSFLIPEGGEMKLLNYGGDLTIKDRDGDIIKRVNWQAGYSQEYTYIYKYKE
jgi:hypothetical protein